MNLTRTDDVLTLTTFRNSGARRGDLLKVSGFVNGANNGLFKIRRTRGTQLLVEPATLLDRLDYYLVKFGTWVRWHYYGVVYGVVDGVQTFCENLRSSWRGE